MSNQVAPEAFFDSLSLAHKLDNFLDGFKLEEIHLFSYFSSILFLYRKNPVSDWGYRFTISDTGYPFSESIFEATKRHHQNGLFEDDGTFYKITARGADDFHDKFKVLPTFSKREEYLNAACTTSILVPYSQTLRALLNDPELEKAKEIDNKSWLEQSNIYEKFDEISKEVGISAEDLVIPAVTWVNYINEKERIEEN